MDTRYSQISSSSPPPLTGSAPLLVRANWLKGVGAGWDGRDGNTAFTHRAVRTGRWTEEDGGGGLLVMFDVIYPTASAFKALLPLLPFSSPP